MEDWQQLLRDGDPVSREPSLAAQDVDRMRRAMLTATPPVARRLWSARLVMVSAAAILAAAGSMWIDRAATWSRPADPPALGAPPPSTSGAAQRRQVQFATPGGTRVIWVFDSTFDVR